MPGLFVTLSVLAVLAAIAVGSGEKPITKKPVEPGEKWSFSYRVTPAFDKINRDAFDASFRKSMANTATISKIEWKTDSDVVILLEFQKPTVIQTEGTVAKFETAGKITSMTIVSAERVG